MPGTNNYYTNDTTLISRSQPLWNDLGSSLDIPWNTVYTAGWMDAKPTHSDGAVWGSERKLTVRRDPEYFAPDNIVRSYKSVLPQINIHNPIYKFERAKHTFTV